MIKCEIMKTKYIRFVASFIISILILSGCHSIEDSPGCPPPENDSYIEGFVECGDTLSIEYRIGLSIDHKNKTIKKEGDYTHIFLHPDKVCDVADGIVLEIEPSPYTRFLDAQSSIYKKIVSSINDENFDFNYRTGWRGCEAGIYPILDTLSFIKITCNENYTKGYPAGSDISSLFFVCFEHPYLVVKNGYKNYEGSDGYRLMNIESNFPHAMIGGNLKTMNFSDRSYIGNVWICQLQQAPDNTGLYSFNVEVTTTKGKKMTTISKPFTIKGKE